MNMKEEKRGTEIEDESHNLKILSNGSQKLIYTVDKDKL